MIAMPKIRRSVTLFLLNMMTVACLPEAARKDVFELDRKFINYQFSVVKKPTISKQDLTVLLQELEKKPASVQALNELAGSYLRLAKSNGSFEIYNLAEGLANQSLKLRASSNNEAQMHLARVANAKHQFQRAIDIAEKILESNPNHFESRQLLITSYIGLGRPNIALEHSQHLLSKIPVDSSQLLHALTLEHLGRDEEAVYYFVRSFELEDLGDPDSAAWKRMIAARFFLKHGNPDLATSLIKNGMEISDTYQAMAYEALGHVAYAEGHWIEADQHYQAAFKISKGANFLNLRAKALEMAGRVTDAVELRNLAFAQMNNDTGEFGHRRDLIEVLIDRGEATDFAAANEYAEVELKSRTDYKAYLQLARINLGQGNSAKALSWLQMALASGFRHTELYFVAAQVYQSTGDPAKARHYLKLAEILAPGIIQPANFKKIVPQLLLSTRP